MLSSAGPSLLCNAEHVVVLLLVEADLLIKLYARYQCWDGSSAFALQDRALKDDKLQWQDYFLASPADRCGFRHITHVHRMSH